MIMTDNDYDKAIVWCKKKIENVKKHHILSGKRLEGYEEAMLCVMSYLHCEKERLADNRRAVEVVRCRDCKYHEGTHVTGFGHCCLYDLTMRYNDFCSYGKRKGGADND